MTEQIHRTKINKSNDRTNTQSEDKQVKWQNKYTERRYTSQMTEQIHRVKVIWLVYLRSVYLFCDSTFFIFVLCICSVIRLVYLRSVYLFCHLTCLSSLCVFILSFDLFIFALCICSVIWLVYLRSVYLVCHLTMTEQIHRTKISKSNDRPNTKSEDKQVKLQNKYALCICSVIRLVYLRSVHLFCHLTCLFSLYVFVLSFDLFIFALCICSVIRLVYRRSVYLFWKRR
jgi:hypothetical protein